MFELLAWPKGAVGVSRDAGISKAFIPIKSGAPQCLPMLHLCFSSHSKQFQYTI